jgi:hypothetical protein
MFIVDEKEVDDRRLVPTRGGSAAVAVPYGTICIDAKQNLSGMLEHELKLAPEPDVLEDLPDDETDLRTLKSILGRNPRLFAKFLADAGLIK